MHVLLWHDYFVENSTSHNFLSDTSKKICDHLLRTSGGHMGRGRGRGTSYPIFLIFFFCEGSRHVSSIANCQIFYQRLI